MPKPIALVAALIAALIATKLSRTDAGSASKSTTTMTAVNSTVKKFKVVPKTTAENWELKTAIDAWVLRESDEINMFGDARGTKYEFGSPLVNGKGERVNDKYDYIAYTRKDSPWEKNIYPAHWGAEPMVQTKDYVKLPNAYGFGSSTLAKWIQGHLDEDAASQAAETKKDEDDDDA